MHYDSSSRLHRNLHGTQKDSETNQFSPAVCDKQTNKQTVCVAKLTVSVTQKHNVLEKNPSLPSGEKWKTYSVTPIKACDK